MWLDGIRAVFFDAVGTLLFPWPSAPVVYAGVAVRYGLDLNTGDVRDRFITAFRAEEGTDAAAGWITSEARERERWHRIVTATLRGVTDPEACFRELFDHFAKPSAWSVNSEAADVLEDLTRRGIIVGLGSNYDARLGRVLEGFPELNSLQDRVVVSAAVGYRKPARTFFDAVVKVAGCEPGTVLFVGDDVANDYDGAEAAGLRPVLFEPWSDPAIPAPPGQRPWRITALRELVAHSAPRPG